MTDNLATPSLLSASEATSVPSQADLYDDLKRIGELEDEKRELQAEIGRRTDRLREAMVHLDKSSLLYKMLTAALGTAKKTVPKRKSPPAKTAKKAKR